METVADRLRRFFGKTKSPKDWHAPMINMNTSKVPMIMGWIGIVDDIIIKKIVFVG